MSEIVLRIIEDKMMAVTDSNGHSIVVGRSPDPKFNFVGIKPSDLLLMAAAACSAYDVVEIMAKQRQPMQDLRVVCSGEQLPDPPWTFTHIHLHYTVKGDVQPDKLEKAINLSQDRYCSVISTLRAGVSITSDYEIVP